MRPSSAGTRPPRLADAIARSALAGGATGGRTFTGLAALAVATPSSPVTQPDRVLANRRVQVVIGLAAVTELVMDKLPMAPSRLEGPGLAGRLVFGGLTGLVVARRRVREALRVVRDDDVLEVPDRAGDRLRAALCVTAGVGAAATTSVLGVRWRAWAADAGAAPLLGALVEDVAVVALAVVAAR